MFHVTFYIISYVAMNYACKLLSLSIFEANVVDIGGKGIFKQLAKKFYQFPISDGKEFCHPFLTSDPCATQLSPAKPGRGASLAQPSHIRAFSLKQPMNSCLLAACLKAGPVFVRSFHCIVSTVPLRIRHFYETRPSFQHQDHRQYDVRPALIYG